MPERSKPIDILLVEDDPGDVLITREALGETKVLNRLHVVNNGEDALKFVRNEPPFDDHPRPGLIFLDLNLPRVDGRQVLEELKSDPDLRDIPVVILTMSSREEDILRSYNLDVSGFVTKPIGLETFVAVVRQVQHFYLTLVERPGLPSQL